MKRKSIHEVMLETKGFSSGFDYLRLGLSTAVLFWHSYLTAYGLVAANNIAAQGVGYLTYWILPMFFSLSGFLVASSLERTPTIRKFLWLRVIRIYPALTVEVILSALILGLLATTYKAKDYIADPEFHRYFLNVIGYIHYNLPGVFENNPYQKIVNGSLWTVPYELECYIALALLAIIGLRKYPRAFLLIFLMITLGKTLSNIIFGYAQNSASNVSGRQLVAFFVGGVLINLNRAIIPMSGLLGLVSFIIGGCLLYSSELVYMAIFPVAYVVVWLGLQRPRKIPIVMGGDYSYGIYLYAGPIQQSAAYWTDIGKTYAGNVALAVVGVSIFSIFSWHTIEKPLLRFKKAF